MRTNIINKILSASALTVLIALCVPSCKKLDEFNPTSLSEENVLRNFNGWKAYQSNIYTGLWGSLIAMPYGVVSEVGTDLWTFPYNNTTSQFRQVIAYAGLTTDYNLVTNAWDFGWGSIKDCNKTIELSTQLTDAA